jgi:hypothetical protein
MNTPTDSYPYDYIWASYIYKYTYFTINGTQYTHIGYCIDEAINWTVFCIPR